jgi:RNA polymerase sigma factor (sigma-70 family)
MKLLPKKGYSDKELISAMAEGEQWALKHMYLVNLPMVKPWLRKKYLLSEADVEDIYQESVIITYENILHGKLNELGSSLSTYIFAVAKNLVRQKLRQEVKFTTEEATIAFELYAPSAENLTEATQQAVKNALMKMEEPCKSILTLFYYADKSIEEIAHALDYKDKTSVKTQKSRCLNYLRNALSIKGKPDA